MGGKVIFVPIPFVYNYGASLMKQKDVYRGEEPPHKNDSISEKDAKLAQKSGQLRPFIAVFPQEYVGQLAYFGRT